MPRLTVMLDFTMDILYVYSSRELEASQNLNTDCELDLFALHYVLMPLLQQEVQKFVSLWNKHKSPCWQK